MIRRGMGYKVLKFIRSIEDRMDEEYDGHR